MLIDPLSVTYNGSAKSLPRLGIDVNSSRYGTADGEFSVYIEHSTHISDKGLAVLREEIKLSRTIPDSSDPTFTQSRFPLNSFGLVFEHDDIMTQTATDIPLLRTALLAFVDSTLQGRILAGEM